MTRTPTPSHCETCGAPTEVRRPRHWAAPVLCPPCAEDDRRDTERRLAEGELVFE